MSKALVLGAYLDDRAKNLSQEIANLCSVSKLSMVSGLRAAMDKQIHKEWQISSIGWSVVILFLTTIDAFYDLSVAPEDQLNNAWYWAIQEWGLWFIITPLLFRALSLIEQQKRHITTFSLIACIGTFIIAMGAQAIFDLYALNDPIPYTFLYFAPLHPLVIFVNIYLWQRLIKPKPSQLDVFQAEQQACITVEHNGQCIDIPYAEIIQFNSASNYVEICTVQKTWLKRATLKEVEANLPDNTFIRTHRSHLVNIKLIKKVTIKPSGSGYVVMSNDNAVALSKAHKKAVKTFLQQAA